MCIFCASRTGIRMSASANSQEGLGTTQTYGKYHTDADEDRRGLGHLACEPRFSKPVSLAFKIATSNSMLSERQINSIIIILRSIPSIK